MCLSPLTASVFSQCALVPIMPPKASKTLDVKKLSTEGQSIVAFLQEEFCKMKTEMNSLFNNQAAQFLEEMEKLKTDSNRKIQEMNTDIVELRTEVTTLKSHVSKLESCVDDADAYERRDTIILSGNAIPLGNNGELCTNIVQEVVKNELRIELPCSAISTAHRLGKKPENQQPDKRSIIVKLCQRDTKRQLMAACKTQNRTSVDNRTQNNPPRLFINESLTPIRRTIYHTLRRLKNSHPDLVCGCSTFDGRVYAYTRTNSPQTSTRNRDRRHLINNHEALKEFCNEFVKLPLESFLDAWER